MNDRPTLWQRVFRRGSPVASETGAAAAAPASQGEVRPLDIPSNDPLLAYVTSAPGVIEVEKLNLDSPTLAALKAEGIKLTLPLVSQGELIGLLNLGARMSEQEYSSDDFRLLNNLATQASPALRVAQLARQQLAEAQERERIEHELRVARVIQETLLPKEIPDIPGWQLDAYWQPAREVSGDFYDFIHLPDGRIGVLVADVTDKGVPAAMVMATSRSILRAASERILEPGDVLARANELLHPDIPAKMFVTCLYLVFEPESGRLTFANAGHNLPYLQTEEGVVELRATGMPLGLMPGMAYEQKEVVIKLGESLLLSSDGIVEAHNHNREMFGFPRLKRLIHEHSGKGRLIPYLMEDFNHFVGGNYEQEDDITLVMMKRRGTETSVPSSQTTQTRTLGDFEIPSEPGNERLAARQVLAAVESLGLSERRSKRLETAVAESTMNAMEHGNRYDPEKPVRILVQRDEGHLRVFVFDHGEGSSIPESTAPDIEAKLQGEQSPRGWGLFLIKNMVDELNVKSSDDRHMIELVFNLEPIRKLR